MRIDNHLPAVYLGGAAVLPRTVSPVAPATARSAAERQSSALRPDSPPVGDVRQGGPWSSAALDVRHVGLRVRQAIEAYTIVRDGSQREYLRRVMGLDATA